MRSQRAAIKRDDDIPLGAVLLRFSQNPVGQTLDARPGHVALQLLHRRAIGEREFPRHDAGERDVAVEYVARTRCAGISSTRESGQCAGRIEIGLVAYHGGEDEGRDGVDQGDAPFSPVLFGKDLDQSINEDMQEVGVIALMDENDAGRELLQQRCFEQAGETFLRHFGK